MGNGVSGSYDMTRNGRSYSGRGAEDYFGGNNGWFSGGNDAFSGGKNMYGGRKRKIDDEADRTREGEDMYACEYVYVCMYVCMYARR